jgi:hypothetical protein
MKRKINVQSHVNVNYIVEKREKFFHAVHLYV